MQIDRIYTCHIFKGLGLLYLYLLTVHRRACFNLKKNKKEKVTVVYVWCCLIVISLNVYLM